RFVAYAATKLLETLSADDYKQTILQATNCRQFDQGALALLASAPDHDTALAILDHAEKLMDGFVSDPDFLDLLRVIELSLIRGELKPEDVSDKIEKIAIEYPTRNPQMNRELVRLVAYLQAKSAAPRMIEQLASDISMDDKLQVALYARFLPDW